MMVRWKAASPECQEADFHTEIYTAGSIERAKSGTALRVKTLWHIHPECRQGRWICRCVQPSVMEDFTLPAAAGEEECSWSASPAPINPFRRHDTQFFKFKANCRWWSCFWRTAILYGNTIFPLCLWVETGRNQLYITHARDKRGET